MNASELKKLLQNIPAVRRLAAREETVWENPGIRPFAEAESNLPLSSADIDDAEQRLLRFAPFIEQRFPETAPSRGIIESPLREIPGMRLF